MNTEVVINKVSAIPGQTIYGFADEIQNLLRTVNVTEPFTAEFNGAKIVVNPSNYNSDALVKQYFNM